MEPTKFDSNVKEQLEKRTIQPSDGAWGKLSQRLDTEEKKRNKPSYWWLGIAASMAGILFFTIQYFNIKNSNDITPQVVNTENVIKEAEVLQEPVKYNTEIQKEPKQEVIAKKEITEPTKALKEKSTLEKVELKPEIVHTKTILQEPKTITEPTKVIQKELTFEEQKIQDIVAQVQELKEHKTNVTDAEIETLLQQAQQEIALKKLYDESTGIVDANALLQDVEEELDQSFRTRVFEALKKSYGTVKTAVANRNN